MRPAPVATRLACFPSGATGSSTRASCCRRPVPGLPAHSVSAGFYRGYFEAAAELMRRQPPDIVHLHTYLQHAPAGRTGRHGPARATPAPSTPARARAGRGNTGARCGRCGGDLFGAGGPTHGDLLPRPCHQGDHDRQRRRSGRLRGSGRRREGLNGGASSTSGGCRRKRACSCWPAPSTAWSRSGLRPSWSSSGGPATCPPRSCVSSARTPAQGLQELYGRNPITGVIRQVVFSRSSYRRRIARLLSASARRATHFLGAVPYRDMPAVYARSRIVVTPSVIPEPFGLPVVEAMAAGRPVVASRAGRHPGTRGAWSDGAAGRAGRAGGAGRCDAGAAGRAGAVPDHGCGGAGGSHGALELAAGGRSPPGRLCVADGRGAPSCASQRRAPSSRRTTLPSTAGTMTP